MKTSIWQIDKRKLNKTNLYLYSDFIKKKYKINSQNDFNKIWKWSVTNPQKFWKSIWEFTKVKGNIGNFVIKKSDIFYKNKCFSDAK